MKHELISQAIPRSTTKPAGFTTLSLRNGAERLAEVYKVVAEANKLKQPENDFICDLVCAHFEITPEQMKQRGRARVLLTPRQIFSYLAMKYRKQSQTNVGDYLGGYDHTSIRHSCITVQNLMDSDPDYRLTVQSIENKIR